MSTFVRCNSRRPRGFGVFFFILLVAVLLCLARPAAAAQDHEQPGRFDATLLREPVDLSATWLVHAGDDPAFAQPEFDDAQWTPFDPHTSIVRLFAASKPEVVWYRMRVKVSPDQTGLALREYSISRAYEIYVNGERLIATGSIAPFAAYTVNARILARIPDQTIASGTLSIAMRVHISKSEWISGQDPGFYASNLTLGTESTLYRQDWLEILGENGLNWLSHFFSAAVGLVALVLFAAQRRQREYLWVFAVAVVRMIEFPVVLITRFHDLPITWQILSDLPSVVSPLLYLGMYFAFVRQRMGWKLRIFVAIAGVSNLVTELQGVVFTSPLPLQLLTNLPVIALFSVVIPAVLARHFLRGNREAGILLIPGILFSLYLYAEVVLGAMFEFPGTRETALHWLNTIDRYPAGPFVLSLNQISEILSTLSLVVIILLRSSRMSRRQAILESELQAAQQVQQILLPEETGSVPGFQVESVYQPAQQVGGDFFQVLPAGGGGLLVVVGDVAGKGLPAAMLVSVLVGAIRAVADYTSDPAEVLASLNERLIGRAHGSFATALAAHIAANGAVTIANAGHLSPYLDGQEIELAGALPLGVVSGVQYETTRFHLAPGSRLTFYSDGVIEAQNARGELLGFERGRELSTQPAAAIVEAAQSFGQEDDITVVTIERAAAVATAA